MGGSKMRRLQIIKQRRMRYNSRCGIHRAPAASRLRIARYIAFIYLFFIGSIYGYDRNLCTKPLGMESGEITDEQLTGSSWFGFAVEAKHGRLNCERGGGAWCPKPQVEAGIREYLEVDLQQVHIISAIATQGRNDKGRGQEYMEEFSLEYYRPRLGKWRVYRRWDGKKIFTGNSDTTTINTLRLEPAIVASKIRVVPYSVHRRSICTRIELFGCQDESGILSYSVPISGGILGDLNDTTYDGTLQNDNMLVGGLGRLTDGLVGADSYTLDIGQGKGTGWVAWKNSSFAKKCIEIIFEFSSVRNFTEISIYTNNYYPKNVQVFGRAVIFFKIDDKFYIDDPIVVHPKAELQSEKARNISIKIPKGAVGKIVKLRLYFVQTWLMLGEMYFTSVPIHTNISEENLKILVDDAESEPVFDKHGNIVGDGDEDDPYLFYAQYALVVSTMLILMAALIYLAFLLHNRYKRRNDIHSRSFSGKKVKEWIVKWTSASPDENTEVDTEYLPESMAKLQLRAVDSDIEHYSEPNNYCPKQSVIELTKHGYSTKISNPIITDDGGFNTDTAVRRAITARTYEVTPQIHHYNTPNAEVGEHNDTKSKRYRSANSVAIDDINVQSKQNCSTFKSNQETHRRSDSVGQQPVGSFPPRPFSTLDHFRRNKFYMNSVQKVQLGPKCLWNIGPSAVASIAHPTGEFVPVPLHALSPYTKISVHPNREIRVCASDKLKHIANRSLMVQVRHVKLTAEEDIIDYNYEVRLLASLSHPGLCNVIGVVTNAIPPLIVQEYTLGLDLCQILTTSGKTLSFQLLIFITTQICCAMRYLESKGMVHKDLAARNCLVYSNNRIKVTDVAMYSKQYKTDYFVDDSGKSHPLRWMSWESILLGHTTCASTVWSFAVTTWEILQHCSMKPYSHLSEEQLMRMLEHLFYGGELQECLPRPKKCPLELYKILRRCWQRHEQDRPTFGELYNCILQHYHEDLPFEYLL